MSTSDDLTVDIPAAELPAGFVPPKPEERAEPKVETPIKPAPTVAKPDPRDAEIRRAQDDLRREQAERTRIQKELEEERARGQTDQERMGRLEAETYRRTGQALYAHGQSIYAEHQQVVNALHACKMEMDSAKRELEIALADDNLEARERARRIADANERIGGAAADQRSLESGKVQLEDRLRDARSAMEQHQRQRPDPRQPERREERREEQPRTPQTDSEKFEAYLSQFPKVSQDWLREHPEYVRDMKLNKKLIAAASQWDADEKPLHTADFISHLNSTFFPKPKEESVTQEDDGQAEEIDVTPEPAPAPKAKSAPAAPVSRSAAPARPSAKTDVRVRLTPAEQEHAMQMFGPGTKLNLNREDAIKRYGRNKLQAEADGKYLPR